MDKIVARTKEWENKQYIHPLNKSTVMLCKPTSYCSLLNKWKSYLIPQDQCLAISN
jgi:hypothetical protein